jgi:tetratricopeptide (TPR) repeat protein
MLWLVIVLGCGPPAGGARVPGTGRTGTVAPEPGKQVSPFAAQSFLEAELALAAGDPATAVQALTLALTSEPEDLLIRVRLAQAYQALGKMERAGDILSGVLDEDPTHDAALVAMGDLALALGRPEDAVQYYRQAIEAEPSSMEGYVRLADLHEQAGDPRAALEIIELLLAVDSTDADALLRASDLCLEIGETEKAFDYMSRHITARPVVPMQADRYGSLLGLAADLLENGETERAIFLYSTFLGMFPGHGDATAGLARSLVAAGDTLRARALILTLPDPDPGGPASARLLKADLLLLAGDAAAALVCLEAGFGTLSVELPAFAKLLWIQSLARTFRFDEARSALDLFREDEDRARIAAQSDLAASMMQAWLFEDGWTLVTGSSDEIAEHLESRPLRQSLLVLLLECSDPTLIDEVQKALGLHTAGRLVLAEADFWSTQDPDPQALLDALERIHEEAPSDGVTVDAWVLEAVCTVEGLCKSKPTRILSLATRIAELEPTDPRLPGLKAMFLLATGNQERALVGLKNAVARRPTDPLTRVWLASLLDDLGQDERAVTLLDSAALMSPTTYVLHRILEARLAAASQ